MKGLEDTSCEKHSCSACHTRVGVTWTLRGICEEEQVRNTYGKGGEKEVLRERRGRGAGQRVRKREEVQERMGYKVRC